VNAEPNRHPEGRNMTAPLTGEDKAFIRAILDHPDELTTWLAYADWLDDRGDPRAEFLRLRVRRRELSPLDPAVSDVNSRLGVLADELDPKWLLAFNDTPLWNCRSAYPSNACRSATWATLSPTDEPDIRLCHECRRPAFYCTTAGEARDFTACGQVIALSPRIPPGQLRGLVRDEEDEFEDSEFDDEEVRDADPFAE
jgi:uncharacterized protein (TIGR02996 family)